MVETAHGLMELPSLFVADDLLLGIVVDRGYFGWDDVLGGCNPAATVLDVFADDIDGESIYKGAQFRLELESGERHVEFDEYLLCQFLNINACTSDLEAKVGDNGLILFHNFFVSVDVTSQYVAYDLFFVHGRICY